MRDAVIDLLRRFGMTRVFGNPGSTELPLFRDFPADFRYVLGLQEAVVVGMADGHAQASDNASFVNLHSAAGVGNAMGNIFTAFRNRTPMVITAGQQARSILPFEPFLFSGQAAELPEPYVKWSVEPARAEDVPQAIARAYHIAMQEPRGPVLVSIPADDWDRPAAFVAGRVVSRELRPDPAVLQQVGAALDVSERPAFVVGAGLLGGHDMILVIGAPAFTYHIEGSGPHVPHGATLCQLIDDPAVAAWTPTSRFNARHSGAAVLEDGAAWQPPARRPAGRPLADLPLLAAQPRDDRSGRRVGRPGRL